jgi:hypothetical protein
MPEDAERRERLHRLSLRLRTAFLAGAEEESVRRLGRPLNATELARIVRRYPGDWDER